MQIQRMRLKICLVGDRGVGKTSLIRRFAGRQFLDDERGTLGAHMHPVEVEIPLDGDRLAKVRVDLFDFMGEHALRDNFRDAIFYGAHGVLAVCDLGRRETLPSIVDWVQAVSSVAGHVPAVVAFNKSDLGKDVAIGASDMRALMEKLPSVSTMVTSARTGEGVEEAFNRIILKAVEGILDGEKDAASREGLRYELLSAIAHREVTGRSKGDLIGAFKSWDPKVVMEELDNLVELGLITPAEYTSATFVDTKSIPVTAHFTITAEGKQAVLSPSAKKLVVGAP
ncbi:MAG TPA: GTP-binding protein [Thermoplasmata archaeon]|nr:GTP-binding protein [Thermoplasmata archaeon]